MMGGGGGFGPQSTGLVEGLSDRTGQLLLFAMGDKGNQYV